MDWELTFTISPAAMRRPNRRASAFRELLRRLRALLPQSDPLTRPDFWGPLLRGITVGMTWSTLDGSERERMISLFRRIRGLDVAWRASAEKAAS